MNRSNSGYDRTDGKSTDPREKHILLGIDETGAYHHYHAHAERVHVVAPDGTREHVYDMRGRSLDDYMKHVDEVRGWARQKYGLGLAEMAARALDANADLAGREARS